MFVDVVLMIAMAVMPVRAEEAASFGVQDIMSTEDFAACGLTSLSDEQLRRFNAWFAAYTNAVVKLTRERDTQDDEGGRTPMSTSGEYSRYEGATVVAQDGQYLGVISRNQFDSDSIANKFGSYGSRYSQTSILNKYSQYGGDYSRLSPFSKYASEPPLVLVGGEAVAYLTVNEFKSPRLDPHMILGYMGRGRE